MSARDDGGAQMWSRSAITLSSGAVSFAEVDRACRRSAWCACTISRPGRARGCTRGRRRRGRRCCRRARTRARRSGAGGRRRRRRATATIVLLTRVERVEQLEAGLHQRGRHVAEDVHEEVGVEAAAIGEAVQLAREAELDGRAEQAQRAQRVGVAGGVHHRQRAAHAVADHGRLACRDGARRRSRPRRG